MKIAEPKFFSDCSGSDYQLKKNKAAGSLA
jgi:hypothetical protein